MAERPLKRKRSMLPPNIPTLPALTGDVHLDVFTHHSLRQNAADVNDNERFTDLGRVAVQLVVTQILISRDPPLPLKELQARLVSTVRKSNSSQTVRGDILSADNVASWTAQYKLATSVRAAHNVNLDPSVNPTEAADLFFAYAGGVCHQLGVQRLESWIRAIVEPAARPAPPPPGSGTKVEPAENGTATASTHRAGHFLQLCNQKAQKTGSKLTYDDTMSGPPHNPVWVSKMLVDGVVRGEGRSENKKRAKEEAAQRTAELMGWEP